MPEEINKFISCIIILNLIFVRVLSFRKDIAMKIATSIEN